MFSLCHNRDPWKQIESGKVWEMLPYCPCPVVVDRANSPVVGTHKACGVQDPMGSPSHHPLSPFYNKPTSFYWKSSQFASQNLWLTLELCCHSFWELSKEFGKLGGGKSCNWTQKPWEIEKGVGQDLKPWANTTQQLVWFPRLGRAPSLQIGAAFHDLLSTMPPVLHQHVPVALLAMITRTCSAMLDTWPITQLTRHKVAERNTHDFSLLRERKREREEVKRAGQQQKKPATKQKLSLKDLQSSAVNTLVLPGWIYDQKIEALTWCFCQATLKTDTTFVNDFVIRYNACSNKKPLCIMKASKDQKRRTEEGLSTHNLALADALD